MAGILSEILGHSVVAVDQVPSVGLENQQPNAVILETEYSFFLKLTNEQMAAVMAKYENNSFEIFMEGKLPGKDAMRPRIRQVMDAGGKFISATMETKIPVGDSKEEHSDPIGQVNFRALCMGCDTITTRIRIVIPVVGPNSTYKKSDGTDLAWQLDLFFNPVFDGSINNWVKLELEVDAMSMPDGDVIKMIPMEYEQLLNSKSQDPEDRKIIGDLYVNGYNIATNPNVDHHSVPSIQMVGTEEYFTFYMPAGEDYSFKTLGIATVIAAMLTALIRWISSKFGGGSSSGSGGGSSSSSGLDARMTRLNTVIKETKASEAAAPAVVRVAKQAVPVIAPVAAQMPKERRVISVAEDTLSINQKVDSIVEEVSKNQGKVDYVVFTRKKVQTMEEFKTYAYFNELWGYPSYNNLMLLPDEFEGKLRYIELCEACDSFPKLRTLFTNDDPALNVAAAMARAHLFITDEEAFENLGKASSLALRASGAETQVRLIGEKLPGLTADVDAIMNDSFDGDRNAVEATMNMVFNSVSRYNGENGSVLASSTEETYEKNPALEATGKFKPVGIRFTNIHEALKARDNVSIFVDNARKLSSAFTATSVEKLWHELDGSIKSIENQIKILRDVAEKIENNANGGGDGYNRKTYREKLGPDLSSKYFNLRHQLTMWATTLSHIVNDISMLVNVALRICEAVNDARASAEKGSVLAKKLSEATHTISSEEINAYHHKHIIMHG